MAHMHWEGHFAMKTKTECCLGRGCFVTSAVVLLLVPSRPAATENHPRLSVARTGAGVELSWPGVRQKADGSTERPYFELQRSGDLRRWEPVGQRLRAPTAQ